MPVSLDAVEKRSSPPLSRLQEGALLFAIFLDMVGFGMALPDIQIRLEAMGARGWLIGSVLASYFLVQVLVSPLWGRVSDRIGPKWVLLLCGSCSVAAMLTYAFAHSIEAVLMCRILAGFAAANVVVAQAYLADAPSHEARTAAMGRIGAVTTGGLILGPALGGWLASLGGNWLLGWVAAGAAALGVAWIALAVPYHLPKPGASTDRTPRLLDFSLLREVEALKLLFALASVAFFALACLEGTFGRLIRVRFGYGAFEYGLLFSYEAILGVLVQTVLLKPLSARWGERPLLHAAYSLQGLGLALTPFVPNLTALIATSTLFAVGAGLAMPSLNSLCSAVTPQTRQGEMFGLLQSARSAGFLLGPILGGALFDWQPAAPYLLAGGIALGIGLLGRFRPS